MKVFFVDIVFVCNFITSKNIAIADSLLYRKIKIRDHSTLWLSIKRRLLSGSLHQLSLHMHGQFYFNTNIFFFVFYHCFFFFLVFDIVSLKTSTNPQISFFFFFFVYIIFLYLSIIGYYCYTRS
jgi:hypothetical protein